MMKEKQNLKIIVNVCRQKRPKNAGNPQTQAKNNKCMKKNTRLISI